MHRDKGVTTFGIPAPHGGDPLHNLRASAMFSGVLRLCRNEDTFTHVPAGKKAPQQANDADERVFATLSRLIEEGKRVTTGRDHELSSFKPRRRKNGPPWELDDLTRDEVRAAVKRLLAAGRILRNGNDDSFYLSRE
jgi:hypothetical protein